MTHCVKPMPVAMIKTGFTLVHPITGVYLRVFDVARFNGDYVLRLAVWSMSKRWQQIPSSTLKEKDRLYVLLSGKRSKSGARLRYDKAVPIESEWENDKE